MLQPFAPRLLSIVVLADHKLRFAIDHDQNLFLAMGVRRVW